MFELIIFFLRQFKHEFLFDIFIVSLSFKIIIFRDGHDFDFKIKIMILNNLIFSDFDFKSSEISMILILKRIQNQNHFMTSYYNYI